MVYFLQIVAWISCLLVFSASACQNPRPLGLTDFRIADWQLSSSSSHPSCRVKHCRLHQGNGYAWCPEKAQIVGLQTQGRGGGNEWVTVYTLMHSVDAFRWNFVRDVYGKRKRFSANTNAHDVRHNYLDEPIVARFLKVYPLDWHHYPSMRLEILGCQDCNSVITVLPYVKMSASTHSSRSKDSSCRPEDADIYGNGAWCARIHSGQPWLQYDLGVSKTVTGLITKGLGGSGRKNWVRSYALAYSNDSTVWYSYRDAQHLEMKVFGGNMDRDTERRHYLNSPFSSRYVRFYPLTWHKHVAMRAAIIGCPHSGECGTGFFRVNRNAECVENLAYKKKTWVNDRRSSWKDWEYGHSSLATDGDLSTTLSRCAILDNYYSEVPLWIVDLGQESRVEGVIIHSWNGDGEDSTIAYDSYVSHLDAISVHVDRTLHLTNSSLEESALCGLISRRNRAVFSARLHVQCPRTLHGRYVHVKAAGTVPRWASVFSMVLCEVMVY